jgi:hypothetical protein
MLIALTDPSLAKLDLGRPLRFADIVDRDTFPIEEEGTYCYCCQQMSGYDISGLQPLTPSSGVFTRLVLCQMDSPVYLCLEHIPFYRDEFEAFTPEVAEVLRAVKRAQREVRREARSR